MAFKVIELSTKFKSGQVEDLVRAVKGVRKLKGEESKVFFPNLGNEKGWKIVANMCDGINIMAPITCC